MILLVMVDDSLWHMNTLSVSSGQVVTLVYWSLSVLCQYTTVTFIIIKYKHFILKHILSVLCIPSKTF